LLYIFAICASLCFYYRAVDLTNVSGLSVGYTTEPYMM